MTIQTIIDIPVALVKIFICRVTYPTYDLHNYFRYGISYFFQLLNMWFSNILTPFNESQMILMIRPNGLFRILNFEDEKQIRFLHLVTFNDQRIIKNIPDTRRNWIEDESYHIYSALSKTSTWRKLNLKDWNVDWRSYVCERGKNFEVSEIWMRQNLFTLLHSCEKRHDFALILYSINAWNFASSLQMAMFSFC